MTDLTTQLQASRIVPVIVIDDPARAVQLGQTLASAGLPIAEITFRTATAQESLRRMAGECPDVLVGAGTVLTPQQVDRAHDAGAKFIVAPGLNESVVGRARERGLPVYPGVCTPTEIEAALALGLEVVKFFPAEAMGGVKFLRAVAAPYGSIRFMPTGGITPDNIGSYLAIDRVVACGGSWMAPAERIAAGDFEWIREATTSAARLVGAKALSVGAAS